MYQKNKMLIIGGVFSATIALLHFSIIIGGPDWYRFFGAGEGMAQLAEKNFIYSSIITGIIALIFTSWSIYAFSGAGIIFRLPLLKIILVVISAVYIIRGLFGIPVVLYIDHPYLNELKGKLLFMVFSSIISLVLGLLYSIGLRQIWSLNSLNSKMGAK